MMPKVLLGGGVLAVILWLRSLKSSRVLDKKVVTLVATPLFLGPSADKLVESAVYKQVMGNDYKNPVKVQGIPKGIIVHAARLVDHEWVQVHVDADLYDRTGTVEGWVPAASLEL